jgi:electron transfer flavoprotein alpha subunit
VQSVRDGQAEVVSAQVDINAPRLQVVETRPKDVYDRGLEQAEVIVDAGQGIQAKEDLQMLEELADLLGGQVTCTRPLSSELEWMPDFLGLSGKHVSPRLCITVGVSGAIQHMVGIRDSKVIVAINSDPNAGIHMQADYSIVGDLYEVVPALTEALKNR